MVTAAGVVALSCGPATGPDDDTDRVPVVDDRGRRVGFAEASELERAYEDGRAVDVYDADGHLAGVWIPGPAGGFEPAP